MIRFLFVCQRVVRLKSNPTPKPTAKASMALSIQPEEKRWSGTKKEVKIMGTEKERKDTQMATIYELRLIFSGGEKEQYSREEILELLDKIALAKGQE